MSNETLVAANESVLTRFVFMGEFNEATFFARILEDGSLEKVISFKKLGPKKAGVGIVGAVVEGKYKAEGGTAYFPFKLSTNQSYNDSEGKVAEYALKHEAERKEAKVKKAAKELKDNEIGGITLREIRSILRTKYNKEERGALIAAVLGYIS